MFRHQLKVAAGVALATALLWAGWPGSALAVGGNTTGYAWGENLGWINFGATTGAVTVTDTAVTGWAWSQSLGWINLGPLTQGAGVRNDGQGVLSGYAWSDQLGWLNLAGVRIDTDTGVFRGTANDERVQAGRVAFACGRCRVVTTWRPRQSGAPPAAAPGTGPGGPAGPGFPAPLVSLGGGAPGQAAGGVPLELAPAVLFDVSAKRVLAERWSWAWVWALCLGLLLVLSGWIYHRTERRRRGPHGPHRHQGPHGRDGHQGPHGNQGPQQPRRRTA